MTDIDRLESLLARVGQTVKDIEKRHYSYDKRLNVAVRVQKELKLPFVPDDIDYEDYILYLVDIIDRMEWGLDNLITALDSRCIAAEDLLELRDVGTATREEDDS